MSGSSTDDTVLAGLDPGVLHRRSSGESRVGVHVVSPAFRSVLVAAARDRRQVRLVDGAVVTLVAVKGSRARVHFAPGADLPNTGPGPRRPNLCVDGHHRTIRVTDIVELVDVAPPATLTMEREET
jgi:hypothetical protein